MKILVACEFSGRVRDAFIAQGHDAISCDLLRSELPGPHYKGKVEDIIDQTWDMMIAFPPCTYLCTSGNRWHAGTAQRAHALKFVWYLMNTEIPKVAIENPVGVISSQIRKPDQIIQPWEFGHAENKATCLWLKGLPKLKPIGIIRETESKVWREPPGPNQWRNRSRTYTGIAEAMASQWG